MSSSLPWGRENQSVCPHWYKRSGSLHSSRNQEKRAERATRNKIVPRMEYPWRFCQVQQETPVQSQPCLVWRDFFEPLSRRLLANESYPTEKLSSKSMSTEDRKAMKIIEITMSKVDDHYQMRLLWKIDEPSLPFNRAVAEERLQHVKKRFSWDPNLESKYRAVINEYVDRGYARKLTLEKAARKSRTTFTADFEATFHKVKVLPNDADALRFLWWSGSLSDPPDEYQMLVLIFGATSLPCCANKAVHQTADDNEDQFDPEVTSTVCRNFYVDDVLKSVLNEERAIWLA